MDSDFEQAEYFAIANTVAEFDRKLLTIKGWGVTLSLVAIGLGFQYRAYGFFLVAAISSFSFWAVEAAVKRHQMRFYVRMRDIEVSRYKQSEPEAQEHSAPRMDWSWDRARDVLSGKSTTSVGESAVLSRGPTRYYSLSFLMLHVALPHAITLLAGVVLFYLGWHGCLTDFALGALKN